MKLPPDHVPGVGIVRQGAMGGVGQKLLEKMGWSVGEGLGKRRDGIREAIRVHEKRDTHGLGLKKKEDWDVQHWMEMYEESLQNVHQSGGRRDSDSSDTQEDDSEREAKQNPDGTSSTAGAHELKIYEQLRKTSKLGRWSSRNGKLERIKKQELRQQTAKEGPESSSRKIQTRVTKPAKKKKRVKCLDASSVDVTSVRRSKSKIKKKERKLRK